MGESSPRPVTHRTSASIIAPHDLNGNPRTCTCNRAIADECRGSSFPDGFATYTRPFHSQVLGLFSPPNITVTPRQESKAIEWSDRGGDPMRRICRQRSPSHSHVSFSADPPNRTVTCRTESYETPAPPRRSGVSFRHTTHSLLAGVSLPVEPIRRIRVTVFQRENGVGHMRSLPHKINPLSVVPSNGMIGLVQGWRRKKMKTRLPGRGVSVGSRSRAALGADAPGQAPTGPWHQAQGCAAGATLGRLAAYPNNPNGVAVQCLAHCRPNARCAGEKRHNPVGAVAMLVTVRRKVLGSSQESQVHESIVTAIARSPRAARLTPHWHGPTAQEQRHTFTSYSANSGVEI